MLFPHIFNQPPVHTMLRIPFGPCDYKLNILLPVGLALPCRRIRMTLAIRCCFTSSYVGVSITGSSCHASTEREEELFSDRAFRF